MPIITNNPESVQEPETLFNRLGIYLSISPVWQENDVTGSVALRLVPYRKLTQGGIDRLDNKIRDVFIADVYAKAEEDPDFAEAFSTILTTLQAYIVKKGL